MKLLLATKNRGKVAEMRAIVGASANKSVEVVTLAELPTVRDATESGETFADNARIKALHYANLLKVLCVADDSGLIVEALDGRPGVRSARYAGDGATDAENNALLLHELAGKPKPWRAAFICRAAAALPGRIVAEADGRIDGTITEVPSGMGGFGYDPLFIVAGTTSTMAGLDASEKNKISHRGQAMRAIVAKLREAGVLG